MDNVKNMLLISTPDTVGKVNFLQKELHTLLGTNINHYTQEYKFFADGSPHINLQASVQNKNVIVYADCFSDSGTGDINSKYMFFRHILNAASSNGASETNIIFPCYPYSRSDRLEENIVNQNPKRVSVMAPIVLQDMIGHGVKNLITLDIHNPTILSGHGNSRLKTTNISYSWMIEQVISDIKNNQNERWIQRDIELGSTDLGGTKKIGILVKSLGLNSYIAYKERDNTKPNTVKQVFIEKGYTALTNQDVIIYDDMIDTAGTMCEVIDRIYSHRPHSINIVASHGLFNGSALEKLSVYKEQGIIKNFYVSDSITRAYLPEWITVLDSSSLIAKSISDILVQ